MPTRVKVAAVVAVLAVTAVILVAVRPSRDKGGLRAGFDAEFLTRPDGYKGLSKRYGFEFATEPVQLDPGLMYRAADDGAVDVIDAFATDGRIAAYNLLVLEDDRSFFPPYHAAPLIRAETLKRLPELGEVLAHTGGRLTDEKMRKLNHEVDMKGRKASDVAREFLVSEGLLAADAKPRDGSSGSITVGGKQFTEQEILGELVAQLIECSSGIAVVRRLNLGGTMICFNALKAGDLDLYAEYTGTGLVNILKREVISDPDEAYAAVKEAFAAEYGLAWLEPFGFNNTYTLTMRRDHAAELGIRTISALADHIRARGAR